MMQICYKKQTNRVSRDQSFITTKSKETRNKILAQEDTKDFLA